MWVLTNTFHLVGPPLGETLWVFCLRAVHINGAIFDGYHAVACGMHTFFHQSPSAMLLGPGEECPRSDVVDARVRSVLVRDLRKVFAAGWRIALWAGGICGSGE